MTYIEEESPRSGCLFCQQIDPENDQDDFVLHRGEHSFVMLNRYPYTNGHMMIVPFKHVASIEELDQECLTELMVLTNSAIKSLRMVYGAENFNLGVNIGEAAGAGIVDHVHLHLLPRWSGDTNFMATTSQTRVIPEALQITYDRLLAAWNELEGSS
jgi:ATP adenylyltransferase